MSGFSFLRRGGDGGGWRAHFQAELNKLRREFPEGQDSWMPHAPGTRVAAIANTYVDAVERDDLPLPLLAAGSDGSLQIRWRYRKNSTTKELSIFVHPYVVEFLQIDPGGEMREGALTSPEQISPLIDWLLAA